MPDIIDNIRLPDERATVKVVLNQDERIRRGELAEGARAEVERLEGEAKEVAAGYKSRVAEQKAILAQQSQACGRGYIEERPLCPARLVRDPDAREGWQVAIYHPTTGDELFRRAPSPGELSTAREPALPLPKVQEEKPAVTEAINALQDADRWERRQAFAERLHREALAGSDRGAQVDTLIDVYGNLDGYLDSINEAPLAVLKAEYTLITGKAASGTATEARLRMLISKAMTGISEGTGE